MHPLVRWQFRGGIAEKDRKAFLFTNIVDSGGRRYDIPVVIGALAANAAIYRIGMNVERNEDIGPRWEHAMAHPVAPRVVERAPCQDIVITGRDLEGPGHGLAALPIPISTPGFDAAPYLTATCVITRDPDTGVQNIGTYRAHLKAPTRLGMMTLANLRGGGITHWHKYRGRGERMPVAIVVGCPPVVAYQGPQRLPHGRRRDHRGRRPRRRADQRVRGTHRRPHGAGRGGARDRGLRRPRLSRAGRPVRRIPRLCRARRVQPRRRGDRDHAAPRCRHPLDHQPGDAERIERGQAPRLRAAVPLAPARQPRHQGDQARRPARAAHQSAQARDPAIREAAPPARRYGARSTGR